MRRNVLQGLVLSCRLGAAPSAPLLWADRIHLPPRPGRSHVPYLIRPRPGVFAGCQRQPPSQVTHYGDLARTWASGRAARMWRRGPRPRSCRPLTWDAAGGQLTVRSARRASRACPLPGGCLTAHRVERSSPLAQYTHPIAHRTAVQTSRLPQHHRPSPAERLPGTGSPAPEPPFGADVCGPR